VISRDADDCVCACRFRRAADWLYQGLPKRLGTCNREVSPEQTRSLRVSRCHPGRTRRFPVLGFELFWTADRPGGPRGKRRTARKTRQRAGQRITAWLQANRPLPGHAFFNGLKARLRGQDRSSGVHGNSGARSRVVAWATACAFKWLNRRGGTRRSCSWARFTQILDAIPIERPRLTEVRRRRMFA